MISFLFWNLNGKPLHPVVSKLADRHDVDVVMLVECAASPGEALRQLNNPSDPLYYYAESPGCSRVQVFTRFSAQFVIPIEEADRWTIRHVKLPGLQTILLAVAHLVSKSRYDDLDQTYEAGQLSEAIRRAENVVGHTRTVLVGDLNMDPFDDGVVSAGALHAVSSRRIAGRISRTIQAREYPFFYNPMWNRLGDATGGTPGTYYYNDSRHRALFWHTFDQVLIRPSLYSSFDEQDIRVADRDGDNSFLTQNETPNASDFSDHLPLLFALSL